MLEVDVVSRMKDHSGRTADAPDVPVGGWDKFLRKVLAMKDQDDPTVALTKEQLEKLKENQALGLGAFLTQHDVGRKILVRGFGN